MTTLDDMVKDYWDEMERLELGPFNQKSQATEIPVSINLLPSPNANSSKVAPGKYLCHYCGISLNGTNFTKDHKIPLAVLRKGPRLTVKEYTDNLVPCCAPCNQLKGSTEYFTYLKRRYYNHMQLTGERISELHKHFYNKGVHDAIIACARLLQSKRDCITNFQIEILELENILTNEKQSENQEGRKDVFEEKNPRG